ncbi:hypothetical protein K8I85_02320 [bacterium]|nr:hypothetical protein [bacterium]
MSTMSKSRKCLFGGTILAAGLMTQAANAQAQFVIGNYYAAGTQTWDGAGYTSNSGSGPFGFSGFDGYGYSQASVAAGSSFMFAYAGNSYGTGYWAQGFVHSIEFTVTQNGTATASWDFSADSYAYPGFYTSGIWVRNLDLGTDVFVNPWDGGVNFAQSGTVQIPLQAGVNYEVELFALAWDRGSSFAELSIPAPGSAALLGLAGLVAVRRRRG